MNARGVHGMWTGAASDCMDSESTGEAAEGFEDFGNAARALGGGSLEVREGSVCHVILVVIAHHGAPFASCCVYRGLHGNDIGGSQEWS